jgi:hypothetical protein
MEVGEARISVEFPDSGITVLVGGEAGSGVDATVTPKSHAIATTIKMERNKIIFFMVEFPFMLKS